MQGLIALVEDQYGYDTDPIQIAQAKIDAAIPTIDFRKERAKQIISHVEEHGELPAELLEDTEGAIETVLDDIAKNTPEGLERKLEIGRQFAALGMPLDSYKAELNDMASKGQITNLRHELGELRDYGANQDEVSSIFLSEGSIGTTPEGMMMSFAVLLDRTNAAKLQGYMDTNQVDNLKSLFEVYRRCNAVFTQKYDPDILDAEKLIAARDDVLKAAGLPEGTPATSRSADWFHRWAFSVHRAHSPDETNAKLEFGFNEMIDSMAAGSKSIEASNAEVYIDVSNMADATWGFWGTPKGRAQDATKINTAMGGIPNELLDGRSDDYKQNLRQSFGFLSEGSLTDSYAPGAGYSDIVTTTPLSEGTILDHAVREMRIRSGDYSMVADARGASFVDTTDEDGNVKTEMVMPVFDSGGRKVDSYVVFEVSPVGKATLKNSGFVKNGIISGEMWRSNNPGENAGKDFVTALSRYESVLGGSKPGVERGLPYMSISVFPQPITTEKAVELFGARFETPRFDGITTPQYVEYVIGWAMLHGYEISDLETPPEPDTDGEITDE
jgi:hypothetical protein